MTVSSPDHHIQTLERDLDKLRDEFTVLNFHWKQIKRSNRALNKHFKQVGQRHAKLNRAYEKHKQEMWYAVVAGNAVIATRAEAKLRGVIEDQAQLQREMPDQYRAWAEAVRSRTETKERRIAWQLKIALKEEEIHRLKPCVSVACQHCKRVDTTGFKKAKVVIKDGLTKMLKVKFKLPRGE